MNSILERHDLIWNFRPINERSLGIFIHGLLWASSPIFFNDPFEGNRDIDETIRIVLASENVSKSDSYYSDIVEHLDFALSDRSAAYTCFCKNASETLMWSHYAEEHKGMSLGFKRDSSFCAPNRASHNNTALHDIHYGFDDFYRAAKAAIEFSKQFYTNPNESNGDLLWELWKKVEYAYHFSKAECWRYEQEVRLDADCSFEMNLEDITDPPKGVSISFEPSDLIAVVFGVSCPEQKLKTVKAIIESLGSEWSHLQILQAKRWDSRLRVVA